MHPIVPVLLLGFLCACQRLPEVYPPPEQRPTFESDVIAGAGPLRASMMVNMSDRTAKSHFVQDISDTLEGGTWRWTRKRPTVKVLLVKTQNLKLIADYTLWEGCMKQTGPVTVAFYINEHLLDKQSYDTPGYKHLDKPVPRVWLQTATETLVAAEIDKLYQDPDGTRLGFILTRIGFERE